MNDTSDLGQDFIEAAERALRDGTREAFDHDRLRKVVTVALRLYAAKVELDEFRESPVEETIMPTEVVIFVSEVMHAVDINLFDLAMWHRRAEPSVPATRGEGNR